VPMIDRLEVRRRQQDGADVHVIVDIGPVDATFQLSLNGRRTNRTAPREGVAPIIARLDTARLPAVPLHPSGGDAIGYEITISAAMTQSRFRWVAATPEGWAQIAASADELIALAQASDASG
jgi:hypothetical protein